MRSIYNLFIRVLNVIVVQIGNFRMSARSAFTRANILRMGGQVQGRIELKRGAHIFMAKGAQLKIGSNFRMDEGCSLFVSESGILEIGDDVFIGKGSVVAARNKITIGNHTQIAHYVTVIDTDHRFGEPGTNLTESGHRSAPVEIGKNVWLGAGALILRGASIGDGSVAGAGAVVTKPVPPYHVALGNPAVPRAITK
ncbi:MAG: acyltransferase [Bdellovibrionota bacterium]